MHSHSASLYHMYAKACVGWETRHPVDLSQGTNQCPALPKAMTVFNLNTVRDFKTLASFSDDKDQRCLHIRIRETMRKLRKKELNFFLQTKQSHLVPKLFSPVDWNTVLLEREQSD